VTLAGKLSSTDKLLAGYLGFVTVLAAARGLLDRPTGWWLLAAHLLFWGLLALFARLRDGDRVGQWIHVLYPLLLLIPLYWEIGVFGWTYGVDRGLAHDLLVQRWEGAIFGGQVSYDWIRRYPSVFWSGLFHLAYFAYYPIIISGPVLLVIHGRRDAARGGLFPMMIAFVACYVVFLLYPVGGPYYAFDQPTGPVREVWSARLVYRLLEGGSSFGAAFPSSHVAVTVSTTCALWHYWRALARWVTVPCVLLTVGTVYCQMHYGIDAALRVLVGLGAGWLGTVKVSGEQ